MVEISHVNNNSAEAAQTKQEGLQKLLTECLLICLMHEEKEISLPESHGLYHGTNDMSDEFLELLEKVKKHPLSLMDFQTTELNLTKENISFFLRSMLGNKYTNNKTLSLHSTGIQLFDKAYAFAQEFDHYQNYPDIKFHKRPREVKTIEQIMELYIGDYQESGKILGLIRAFLHLIIHKDIGDTVINHQGGYRELSIDSKFKRREHNKMINESPLFKGVTFETKEIKKGIKIRYANDIHFNGVNYNYIGRIKTIDSTIEKLRHIKYQTINKHTDEIGERFYIKGESFNNYVDGGLKILRQLYQETDFDKIPNPRIDVKGPKTVERVEELINTGIRDSLIPTSELSKRFKEKILERAKERKKNNENNDKYNDKTIDSYEEIKMVSDTEKQIRRENTENEKGLGHHAMYDLRKKIKNQIRGEESIDTIDLKQSLNVFIEENKNQPDRIELLNFLKKCCPKLKKNPTRNTIIEEILVLNCKILGLEYTKELKTGSQIILNSKISSKKEELYETLRQHVSLATQPPIPIEC